MIALNEILSNKEKFENKYSLMGKHIKLDKIIHLEEKFIALDKQINELRAKCNKLCSEISNLVNSSIDTSQAIFEINLLDKTITSLENKSSKAMKKINNRLKKLPNMPLDENELNIAIKTTNTSYTKEKFSSDLETICKSEINNLSESNYINSLKHVVFKSENLPKLVNVKSNKQKYLLLCGADSLNKFEFINKILVDNAKYLTIKSIKYLKRDSAKELIATLSDNSIISVEYLGEFVSRENSLKLYDKNLDMTKFVNIIRISIY